MTLASWNVNGYYVNQANVASREFRANIIDCINCDIVSLCETHLKHDELIILPGYKWVGNNRKNLTPGATRGSGGVGFLIKSRLLEYYVLTVLDCSHDDILWIKLTSKTDTTECLYLCSCYLPPQGSSRGDFSQEFYDILTAQIYQYHGDEPLFVLGDVNGRIADLQDFNENLDNVPRRVNIDTVRNQFGNALIDFLKDTKMCVVNGRGDSTCDNYTCISTRGKSVVDYIIAPHAHLDTVKHFRVITVSDCTKRYNITTGTAKLPDHSILLCTVNSSPYDSIDHTITETTGQSDNDNATTFRRYDVTNVPANLFANESCQQQLNDMIQSLEAGHTNISEIDSLYTNLVNLCHKEMNDNLPYRDIRSGARNRQRFKKKPWWCNELSKLWETVRHSENAYLHYKGPNRTGNALRQSYIIARNTFDKRLRQLERQYKAEQVHHISELQTQNPKQFWNHINKLGPGKPKHVIDCVRLDNGSISHNTDEILSKWKQDFSKLLGEASGNYDDNFLEVIRDTTAEWEDDYLKLTEHLNRNGTAPDPDSHTELNSPITIPEVQKVIRDAKLGKSVGFENVPNEILKMEKLTPVLHKLFSICFNNNTVPSVWYKTIIYPILKNNKCYKDPMSYRGISLMSTVVKLFNGVLNNRITRFLNTNNTLCEEQNGFRKLRSCIDNIYSLTTVIRNRRLKNLPTFLCFVDFAKAFDSVNRDCLWFKLLNVGIRGKMINIIQTLYKQVEATVKINGRLTDWFTVNSGVVQGNNLAPTLFSVYVNDVAKEINELNIGVQLSNGECISLLMYADDFVLIAASEIELQRMLDTLHNWSDKWRLSINIDKTKIMHCRKQNVKLTDHRFLFGDSILTVAKSYRYLGMDINEHLNYTHGVNVLRDAGSRALGAICAKHFATNGLTYKTYEKLYNCTVTPVTDYAAGVWGFKPYDVLDKLQNRALRTFLCVGKQTPILAVHGDTNWTSPTTRRHCDIVRLWHRLANFSTNRIAHKVLTWDILTTQTCRNTWYADLCNILTECGLNNYAQIDHIKTVSSRYIVSEVKSHRQSISRQTWCNEITQSPKLRTYVKFKHDIGCEQYLNRPLNFRQRSALARLRFGTFPLAVELGRYRRPVIPVNERTCRLCNDGSIEDEAHFLVNCPSYSDLRHVYFSRDELNDNANETDRLVYLMTVTDPKQLSNYIIQAYELRGTLLVRP
ncbi:MAG: reverse transcriptase family protein [Sedimenticola sp.]